MDAVALVVEEEEEEKECEDWCFICKDGGSLILCDYKDCPKVYHDYCVEKEDLVRLNGDSLICKWHTCYLCGKGPKHFCLCCPHAVCEGCATHAEFVNLKGNKGLCNQCQEYVFALEEIQEYDAAGGKIDLSDPNTFECLFLEYWEIMKSKEALTFDDVCTSSESQRKVLKSRRKSAKLRHKDDPKFSFFDGHTSKSRKKSTKLKYKDDTNFSPADHGVEDAEDYKRRGNKRNLEFIRWGSKPLIDFLTSIGEDTKDAMTQYSVEAIIRRYIREKNLLDHEKKKRVRCDEKLYSIFRKKSLNQNKIYNLLEGHFKENLEQLEHIIDLQSCFSEKNENVSVPCKKQKTEKAEEITYEKEVGPKMRSTGFASINVDNIKPVYLRKSLIVELLKHKESFGNKVVGSFVKVKNDPRDFVGNQILQVTGIKAADDQSGGMLLYVSGIASEVSISKLDDSDITEEEIKDLNQKVMNGLLRQPTVMEMEEKAKALHEDITKHWITRQLTILQNRINYANEKGWRRELSEYLEQRELLQQPSEQERLIRERPMIIEDLIEIKTKTDPSASSDCSRQVNINSLSQEAVIDIN